MVSNLNSKRFVIWSGQYKIAGAMKESRANEMNVMEMQTHISMQEEMDRWNVTESGTGANELQMKEAMDRCNVTETGTGATELQVHGAKKGQRMHRGVQRAIDRWTSKKKESMDCWDVVKNSGAANGHQDTEAKESWKDVERVGVEKGERIHRGMQRAIDCWK